MSGTLKSDRGTYSGYEAASGTLLEVASGGTALNATIDNGATLELLGSWCTSGSTISSGGTLEIASGYLLSDYEATSGVVLEVVAGGTEIVSTGSADFDAQIVGGEQDVFGYAGGATVLAGSQLIEAGGTASGTNLGGGIRCRHQAAPIWRSILAASRTYSVTPVALRCSLAPQSRTSAGTASDTILNGGVEFVSLGGVDFSVQLSGGELDVLGLASGATVSTGSIPVESGGSAIDFTILSGGVLVVSSRCPARALSVAAPR